MGVSSMQRAGFLLRLVILAAVGVVCAAYLFVQQRGPVPLRDVYRVDVELTAADGVASGLGQPVNVAGVKVGSIVGTRLAPTGNAVVTLEIDRDELPAVHSDARATLEPITPLKDMQIELDPGSTNRPELAAGARIPVARTVPPAELSTLLSALDGDTRAYFQSLMKAMQVGTEDRALNLRLLFAALGPTTAEARKVSEAIVARRRETARLVSNLAVVARAAARDDRLDDVVRAGSTTLAAVRSQDGALRRSLDELPATLEATSATLESTARFSRDLTPALEALRPAVRALPATFGQTSPFAEATTAALRSQVRPAVREVRPLVRDLTPAVQDLSAVSRPLSTVLKTANYALNELAYNPEGNDEGMLFWAGFFVHNFGSAFTLGDAHGSIGQAMVVVSCAQTSASAPGELLRLATGSASTCKGTE